MAILSERKAPVEKDGELVDREPPLLNRHSPVSAGVPNREVHHLVYRVVVGKT